MTARVAMVASAIDTRWLAGAGLAVAAAGAPADVLIVSGELLAGVLATLPAPAPPVIAIGDPRAPGAAADPRVAHVVSRNLPPAELALLVAGLAHGPSVRIPDAAPQGPIEARSAQRAFAASRRLAGAGDVAATEAIANDAVLELLDADRAHCLFYDGDDGALWSEAKLRAGGDDRRAIAGLAGFAARTGAALAVRKASADPRWVAAIDDPTGDAADHLLVQPVGGQAGAIHAVLIAVRVARRSPFEDTDAALLARFAAQAGPFLDQLSIHAQAQAILDDAASEGLFRREAVDSQLAPRWGDVVRVTPGWLSWAYWALAALLIGAVVFLTLGTVSTYSAGPVVIRATARTEVTARTAGNVTSLDLEPGAAVTAGAVVARLDDTNQRTALERVQQEFDVQLRNHMLDPSDTAADGALRSLHVQVDNARTAFEDRVVRAAAAGVISDVRVRPGQHVDPGDIVASVVEGNGGFEAVALLPGEDRPQLAPGMTLRLELAGYRYAYQTLAIDSVSSDVISPGEARRVLGAEVADSMRLNGPVVLVRGRLAGGAFTADSRTYRYHDGMLGTAEVRIRKERIIFALFPGSRRLE